MLAALLAIPLVAAELAARKLIGDAVAHAVAARIGVSPKVAFGATPLLISLVHGSLGELTLSARGARIAGLPPMALSATLHGVHLRSLTGLQGGISSLEIVARMGGAGVRDLLATPACAASLPGAVTGALTATPRVKVLAGRVDLLPPHGRAYEVRLRPQTSGSVLRFVPIGVEEDGVWASAQQLALARQSARCSRVLSQPPFGVALVSARAVAGTLTLDFSGTGASFSALG